MCDRVADKSFPMFYVQFTCNEVNARLRPAYAQCFYHVLPSQSATTSSPKVLLLAGDAAISHHFWPGRGLNTGLKSAVAMVNMWKASDPCNNKICIFMWIQALFSGFRSYALFVPVSVPVTKDDSGLGEGIKLYNAFMDSLSNKTVKFLM